ncbi:FtsX-like permease family protein [Salicibibacter cibarius]|uniref:FtsX-like permease family protein n=1 Tax=Salicibibacter cibarius TaxID=2743000 RepID=A0A7T6Z0T0_9BACI|nr:FtsX-like permease family protein [Salicibibacter cibarius]QQK74851.1 FtsX-like permease family protein [Salicibibacter cibarius]
MLFKMLKKDIAQKKTITATLFIFITLSSLLVANGTHMMMELTHSMNSLFTKSNAPHFVQMHTGELDENAIDNFASRKAQVKDHQLVQMVNIDGLNLTLGDNPTPETSGIMDHYFVKQNHNFDYLLNLKNEIIQVSRGEIAVPVYFMQQYNLNIGDKIRIDDSPFDMDFTIVDFVRDVQMNPSIIHSKRFVVNDDDLDMLNKNVGETEYMVEFQLTDVSKLSEFRNAYQAADLPQQGPNIDYPLFKTLHALTDGVVAAVILFVSVLLTLIAMLCIRFIMLTTLEEDYREIGIMKAIGIGQKDIKKMYLAKYIVLAALASGTGFLISLFLNDLFTANIQLYLGTAEKSVLHYMVPFIAVLVTFLTVLLYCMFILRRFNKLTAVEALHSGYMGEEANVSRKSLSLSKSKYFSAPVFLGWQDVFGRFKMYSLLFFVFFVCSFMIIVPVNFLNTVQSPDFIKYMGIEQSDIRIDLQQSDNTMEQFNHMLAHIQNDEDIEQFSPLITSQFKVINSDGAEENITVESGDFSIFPLDYLEGGPPLREQEIALSYLNGQELEKSAGDRLHLIINGREQEMIVSGIYQDVTNGGRTAKALIPFNPDTVLWYEVSVDVKSPIRTGEKLDEYAQLFHPAKVTDLQSYLAETFGNTIEQLRLLTLLTIAIAVGVALLITSLFLKMVMAKDDTQIAIMKSIGFSFKDIRAQYVTKTLLVLGIGITVGMIVANTIGQSVVSFLLSLMGAPEISFVIDPVQAYILCPLILMMVVTIATLMGTVSIKKSSIAELDAE